MRKVAKRAYKIALVLRAWGKVSRLYHKGEGDSKLVADALREVIENRIFPEEKVWVERIESLRENLNYSTDEITMVDYGAGTRDPGRPQEEMTQGRVFTETVGNVCRSTSKPYLWSLLLFKLVRKLRPSVCLELGTSMGISASYQAAALKLNQTGKVVTLEGSGSVAALAETHFRSLGLDNADMVVGRFRDTLDGVLDAYSPIDYAFIDGHHDEKATLDYFEQIFPFLSERAVLVFDDISWSEGMKRAWSVIKADRRVKTSVDLSQAGICMVDDSIKGKQSFEIPIAQAE